MCELVTLLIALTKYLTKAKLKKGAVCCGSWFKVQLIMAGKL